MIGRADRVDRSQTDQIEYSLEDVRSVDRCGGATAIARHGKGYDKREDPVYGGSERKEVETCSM